MLQEAGFDVEVAAFERDYHSGRFPDCPIEYLGKISHGRYARRATMLPRVFRKLRRAIARNDLIYASGIDVALLAAACGVNKRKPMVIEVGDVRAIQLRGGSLGRLVRMVERRLVEASDLLVVTAPRFYDEYYKGWLHTTVPGMVIENKLERAFARSTRRKGVARPLGRPLVDRPLRIGYFGLLRDWWSWETLRLVAELAPRDVEISLAGLPTEELSDLEQMVGAYPNIEYRGTYRSPQDLASLYNNVDMAWVCYPPIGPQDWNLRWARPNRFYESCLFKKPIFTRAGCQDAIDVTRLGIGLVIDECNPCAAARSILSITAADIDHWAANMDTLPERVFAHGDEAERLGARVRQILSAVQNRRQPGGLDRSLSRRSAGQISW
ncbi:MAG: glycosyltransferase [Nannocystaceae bacterium]